jgi:hypothetical protein
VVLNSWRQCVLAYVSNTLGSFYHMLQRIIKCNNDYFFGTVNHQRAINLKWEPALWELWEPITCLLHLTITVGKFTRKETQKKNPRRYSSDEPWPAEQPPLAVFPDCTRRYWVDMRSAHRIPQLHFQLSKPDRYFFIQVITQFIRSRGWVDHVPDPTSSEKS